MRRVVCFALLVSSSASASPWAVTVEGGAEVDSNVQRVETGPALMTTPQAAPVVRLGGRLVKRDKLLGGNYGFAVSTLARLVVAPEADITPEDIALFAADARWMHGVDDRPLSLGLALTGADALPLADAVGARTFVNLGADGLLSLRDEDDHALTLAVGARAFEYKPDDAFDWSGPATSLRLDLKLWESASTASSLELAGVVGVDLRAYTGTAFADACPMEEAPRPECFAPTQRGRHDRYHRAGVELTWTGGFVAALAYQLVVIDSNSYGQSLVRHRVTASSTIDLTHKIYATLSAIVTLETYTDGLVVQTDPDQQSFTSLEDENRSSASLRFGRPVSSDWSLEARVAYWRNLSGSDNSFERALVYFGAIYSR